MLEYWNDEKKAISCELRVTGCELKKEIIPIMARNAQLGTRNAINFHYSIPRANSEALKKLLAFNLL